MVYKPLAVRVALIAGAPCGESGSDCGFSAGFAGLQIHDSRSRSRGNVGIPTGISKGCGKGGKPALWLSMLSIPRHFHGLFLGPLGFQLSNQSVVHTRSVMAAYLELSPYVLIFRKAKTNTTTPNTRAVAGARISAHSVISPLRSLWQRNIAPTNPTIAARTAATPDITNAMKLSPAVDFIVVTS